MRAFATIVAAYFCFGTGAAAQTPLGPEAFGRLPAVSDAAISPDGSKVALAVNENGQSIVEVLDLAQRRIALRANVPAEEQLRQVGWVDDQRLDFVVSEALAPNLVLPENYYYRGAPRRVEFTRPGVVNLATRQIRLLTTNHEGFLDSGADLVAPIEGDANIGRMIGASGDSAGVNVFSVDLNTGGVRVLTPSGKSANTISFLVDRRGDVLTRTDVDNRTNRWSIFAYDAGSPHLLLSDVSRTGSPQVLPRGLLADGRLAALRLDDANGLNELIALDRASGAQQALFERNGYDVDDAITDPWTREVVGVTWTEDEVKQHFFDANLQSAYDRLQQSVAGAQIISWSRDRSHLLVYAEHGLDGGGYYVLDSVTGEPVLISYRYPELAAVQSGVREAIIYRARDGTPIPAYLTLPNGAAHNLPLVVLVHGGPADRDALDFDWWAAFLASRGYAVLQPNYRGSAGYGQAWEDAGHGEWGGLMETDIEDGIAPLGHAGIVDPSRACIVGASYGGYAALAGATLTPDRYKCAVSVAGISDLVQFVTQREMESGATSEQSDYWRESIGDRHDDGAHLRATSPANLADRVRIPVLLIHGTNDIVVPIDQSRLMRDRLAAAHKNVRYVELQGDDHWLSNAATRTQLLREIDVFLAQNLPVQAGSATPVP